MRWTALESILNRNIAASSEARAACRRLTGKILALEFSLGSVGSNPTFYFRCDQEAVNIESAIASTTDASNKQANDTVIRGTPLAFINMLKPKTDGPISGGLRIEGDAEVAQAFRDLMQAAKPDVEEELSRFLGDVGAHQLMRFARDTAELGMRIGRTFAQNVSEFLQEESRDVVTRTEIDEFNVAIDKVRDDVERAAARVERLAKQLDKNKT